MGLSNRLSLQLADLFILVASVAAWLHAAVTRHEYSVQIVMAAIIACLLVSARVTGDTVKPKKDSPWASTISSAFTVGEFLAAAFFGVQLIAAGADDVVTTYGGWLIGTIICHQMANALL
jgi:hypothetical protein